MKTSGTFDVSGQVNSRADDNEDTLKNRLMAYYRETSRIGYYFAHGKLRSVDGMASIENVEAQLSASSKRRKIEEQSLRPKAPTVKTKICHSANLPTAVMIAVAISALAIVSSFTGLVH